MLINTLHWNGTLQWDSMEVSNSPVPVCNQHPIKLQRIHTEKLQSHIKTYESLIGYEQHALSHSFDGHQANDWVAIVRIHNITTGEDYLMFSSVCGTITFMTIMKIKGFYTSGQILSNWGFFYWAMKLALGKKWREIK